MLRLIPEKHDVLRVLCLGAHADDVEIGCGGTLLELLGRPVALDVTWVVLSAAGLRGPEARRSAQRFLRRARQRAILTELFRDGFFPAQHAELKEYFEGLKRRITPDVILTHHRDDLHQDHRLVSELTWNTFRDHLILEYEIPKYDGGLGSPNSFVAISRANSRRKIELLMRGFASQRSKRWFSEETFRAMMRIRGVECNAPSGHAEAFYVRKVFI